MMEIILIIRINVTNYNLIHGIIRTKKRENKDNKETINVQFFLIDMKLLICDC